MNKRKLRITSSREIHDSLELAVQFQNKIEEACVQYNVMPYDLPNSVLPTNVLYDIVIGYSEMYKKLLEEELIYSSSNYKINAQTH
jgi:hypothetical protein